MKPREKFGWGLQGWAGYALPRAGLGLLCAFLLGSCVRAPKAPPPPPPRPTPALIIVLTTGPQPGTFPGTAAAERARRTRLLQPIVERTEGAFEVRTFDEPLGRLTEDQARALLLRQGGNLLVHELEPGMFQFAAFHPPARPPRHEVLVIGDWKAALQILGDYTYAELTGNPAPDTFERLALYERGLQRLLSTTELRDDPQVRAAALEALGDARFAAGLLRGDEKPMLEAVDLYGQALALKPGIIRTASLRFRSGEALESAGQLRLDPALLQAASEHFNSAATIGQHVYPPPTPGRAMECFVGRICDRDRHSVALVLSAELGAVRAAALRALLLQQYADSLELAGRLVQHRERARTQSQGVWFEASRATCEALLDLRRRLFPALGPERAPVEGGSPAATEGLLAQRELAVKACGSGTQRSAAAFPALHAHGQAAYGEALTFWAGASAAARTRQEAEQAFERALAVLTPAFYPQSWATASLAKAEALLAHGQESCDREPLERAGALVSEALARAEEAPLWASSAAAAAWKLRIAEVGRAANAVGGGCHQEQAGTSSEAPPAEPE